jgi:hypothetical protein
MMDRKYPLRELQHMIFLSKNQAQDICPAPILVANFEFLV